MSIISIYKQSLYALDRIGGARKGKRLARSLHKRTKHNKMPRKRKNRKRKHGRHRKGASTIDQSRHKDTMHKAAALRQKREYLSKAFWDSFDSGYEEPLIYDSMDMVNVESNADGIRVKVKKEEKLKDKDDKNARSWKEKATNDLKKDDTEDQKGSIKIEADTSKSLANVQLERNDSSEEDKDLMKEEEPITGKDQLEDEILLLNKRQAWKKKNEQQLEEVAFGEDMRKSSKDKELYEKLTEIDKKINDVDKTQTKNCSVKDYTTNNRNSCNLSNEDKLRMLEEKINVYADNEREEKARGKK
ncbi:DNA topoisomerase 1-like [Bombus terrestris]|uniref:DNA topoisomerase 1-like n=1 Tax=Bombus terrestris TaxID=30195 RepID=A0A9B7CZ00_BOMTE|nr:DNA topoisomerase 1-like [Bombus terrestris]